MAPHLVRIRVRVRVRVRANPNQMAAHLAIHEGELGASQPAAPQVPRERGVCAQRRRLLRVVWLGGSG